MLCLQQQRIAEQISYLNLPERVFEDLCGTTVIMARYSDEKYVIACKILEAASKKPENSLCVTSYAKLSAEYEPYYMYLMYGYDQGLVIDFSGRIQYSQDKIVTPINFLARLLWYYAAADSLSLKPVQPGIIRYPRIL